MVPHGTYTFINPKMTNTALSPKERLKLLEEVFQKGSSVSDVCKKYGISRFTFYKWKNRWEKAGLKSDALCDRKPQYDRSQLRIGKDLEERVLSKVARNPGLSKYELTRLVNEESEANVGVHGVYNILQRNGLNLPEARYAFAELQSPTVTVPPEAVDRPASPPSFISVVKTYLLSFLLTFFIALGILAWINLITGASPLQGGVGYIFSGLALTMGTLFFLYSLKYYLTLALVLSFSQEGKGEGESVGARSKSLWTWLLGLGGRKANDSKKANSTRAGGLEANLEHVRLTRHPFVSIHIPLYNEKNVVSRVLKASTSFEYEGEYEVIICDDSTDDTTTIINSYIKNNCVAPRSFSGVGWTLTQAEVAPGVILKHLHRTSRQGFKGGALGLALKLTDPRAEFISVFDADFVPYPDTLTLFLKYFQVTAGTLDFSQETEKQKNLETEKQEENLSVFQSFSSSVQSKIAAVQGYQWHVLNKSENWITRGIRSEYSGSYVIERSGEEIYGGLKQISGSVYMVRRDILEEIGWGTSITEDFELTLRLYAQGYKVVYTPYIQAPAECVSTIKSLVRQRMRWAEGHSNNVRKMFTRLLFGRWIDSNVVNDQLLITNDKSIRNSSKKWIPSPLTLLEKLEFLYLSPYYLQAFFFLIGTLSWLISETVFKTHLPFWTELWGWSLVLTNLLALPLMNAVGLFLEESEEKDYAGLASFVALSYILVPFQAYASLKGFLESSEGPWFRTPKTGRITDIFTRGRFYRFIQGILPGRTGNRVQGIGSSSEQLIPNPYNPALPAGRLNPNPLNPFSIHPRRIKWVSKATLAVLLVVVVFLNNLAFFANTTNAQAADPGIEQQINIIDQEYSTTSTSSAPTDNSLGYIYWDSAKYSGTRTINLDIVGRTSATSAQMIAALYDDSGGIVSQSKATIGNANKIATLDGCPECNATGEMIYTHAIVLDSSGYPVISYMDATNDDLKLIHCGNANCTSENVITTVDGCSGCNLNGIVDKHSSMFLNASGNPVIAYHDGTNNDLKLVVCGDANCASGNTYQTVDGCAVSPCANTESLGTYAAMVRDSPTTYKPVIVYYSDAVDDLMFVVCANEDCSSGSNTYVRLDGCVSPGCGNPGQSQNKAVGQYGSIQLDSNNYPVISYRNSGDDDLKLVHCGDATCTPGSATFTLVDNGANSLDSAGIYTSLKLDSSGNPVISFGRGTFGTNIDLRFVHCNDANCVSETPIYLDGQGSGSNCASATGSDCDDGDVGWYNKLQLDTTVNHYPIISYRSQTAGDLKVIHCSDANCSGNNESVIRVDGCTGCDTDGSTPQTGTGAYTALVLDSSGYPVISYRTVSDSVDLKVVHCGNDNCNPTGSGQTDPTNNQRAESMVFTPNLTGGATTRTLTVRVWVTSGTGYIRAARLRIIQNDATRITDTQTQIELGDDQTITATSYGELTNPKYYLLDRNVYSGTWGTDTKAYFEASLKGEGSQGDGRVWSSGFELNSATVGVEFTDITCQGASCTTAATVQSSTVRSGTYAGRNNESASNSRFVHQFQTAASTNNYVRAYFRFASFPNDDMRGILGVGTSANYGEIKFDNVNNTLELHRCTNALCTTSTQLGSDSSALSTGTWYRVELHADATKSDGADILEARLEGTTFASSTAETLANMNKIIFGALPTPDNSVTMDMYTDDVAINDSTGGWPGPGKIIHLKPNATGDNELWTIGGSSPQSTNWRGVDEVPPNDGTDLNYSHTIEQVDDFRVEDSSLASNDDVNVVSVGVRFNGAGASANDSFVVRIKDSPSGAAEGGSAIAPSDATWKTNVDSGDILYPLTIYDLPGSSTTEWSDGTLDTAQIGYRLSSVSNNAAQVSTVWMLVDYTPNADIVGISAQAELQQCDESTGCDAANEWTEVTNSPISTLTSTFQRVRSIDISSGLTDDRRLRVAVKRSSASGTIKIANAKLIIEQSETGGITKLELVHQYINSNTSETATSLTAKQFYNEFDDDNFVGGTFTYYYEATMYCTTGCTGTTDLYNGTSTITNSSITTTSETPTRVRSGSDLSSGMPTTATNLDTRLQATSGDTTYANSSWLIIQVSGLQVPENLLLFLPFVLFLPKILAKGTFRFPNFNPVSFLPKQEDFKRRRNLWRREILSR